MAQETKEGGESEIERLALLQEVDQRVRNFKSTVEALAEEIKGSEEELAQKREQRDGLRGKHGELDTQRRELERKLGQEGAEMKDRRMRLNRVRTEKELLAVRREIELGKEATQQLEGELIACMEEIESTAEALGVCERELAELEAPAEREIADRRGKLAQIESSAAADIALREQLAAKLDVALRGKYEQIFARRGGLAVVAIHNGTCTGCHRLVPPQLVNEIKKSSEVRLCPSCHRILYWKEVG